MNDKEREEKFKIILDNVITKFADNPQEFLDSDKVQIKYNKVLKEKIKLQSNWNSLREWINTRLQANIIRTGMRSEELLFVLDKMNELEGVDNENN